MDALSQAAEQRYFVGSILRVPEATFDDMYDDFEWKNDFLVEHSFMYAIIDSFQTGLFWVRFFDKQSNLMEGLDDWNPTITQVREWKIRVEHIVPPHEAHRVQP